MAPSTFDIVVLSSSPPDHARAGASAAAPQSLSPSSSPFLSTQRVAMSALSPLQLPPRAIPQRKTPGALRSGSNAATIPEGTLRGFATARSLIVANEDEELPGIDWGLAGDRRDNSRAAESSKIPEMAVGNAAATADAAGGDAEVPKPKPKPRAKKPPKPTTTLKRATVPTTSAHFRNPTTDAAHQPAVEAHESANPPEAKVTKPRKPRTKKAPTVDGETQTTIKKARITKPRGTTKSAKATKEKAAADVVSAHFRETTDESSNIGATDASKGDESIWEVPKSPAKKKSIATKQPINEPLELDEAVFRRRDWTPTKDTGLLHVLPDSAGKENDLAVAAGTEKGDFTSLLSGYAYEHLDLTSERSLASGRTAVLKRRRVELVDVPANQVASRQPSPEKGKAPKKKPRTITDLVTEQYAPKSADAEVAVTSDFFSARTTATTSKVPLNDTVEATRAKTSSKPPSRKRSTSKSTSEKEEAKSKSKSKKPPAKTAAKPKLVAERLLSPASALLRLDRQDVLFGTSSQLALEESPTLVRQIQQAMRDSEADADFGKRLGLDVPAWPRLQKLEGKRSLWAASARDEDGATLERQAVYLPEPDRTQDFPLLMDGSMDEDDVPSVLTDLGSPPKSAPAPAPILISSDIPTPPPTMTKPPTRWPRPDEPTSTDMHNLPNEPPPSNQNVASDFLDELFSPSAQLSPDSPPSHRPSAPMTSVSLGSSISLGSLKKKHGRLPNPKSAIPQRVTASAPIPKKPPAKSKPPSTAPPTTPKKVKNSQDRYAAIEEILDSEDDTALSPTPPRTRKLEDSPPLQFKLLPPLANNVLVPVVCIPESNLVFTNIKTTLFSRITSLIRSLPPTRTNDPSKPSWHEKILMYDAIVLEDFTAFLNMHSTIRTYRKATQKQIKAWNKDLKSKGEEKVEEGDGTVLATEKEVEIWMVRAWCEEMSVCCVMRDGRGKGGARKGLY